MSDKKISTKRGGFYSAFKVTYDNQVPDHLLKAFYQRNIDRYFRNKPSTSSRFDYIKKPTHMTLPEAMKLMREVLNDYHGTTFGTSKTPKLAPTKLLEELLWLEKHYLVPVETTIAGLDYKSGRKISAEESKKRTLPNRNSHEYKAMMNEYARRKGRPDVYDLSETHKTSRKTYVSDNSPTQENTLNSQPNTTSVNYNSGLRSKYSPRQSDATYRPIDYSKGLPTTSSNYNSGLRSRLSPISSNGTYRATRVTRATSLPSSNATYRATKAISLSSLQSVPTLRSKLNKATYRPTRAMKTTSTRVFARTNPPRSKASRACISNNTCDAGYVCKPVNPHQPYGLKKCVPKP